jgi:uncharacterized phage protein gp47/JayE
VAVEIKSYNQILGAMVKKILADTALSDMRVGSVISSILESAAQSDFEIHASIVELIKLFSIDTTAGTDLDRRAAEFNVRRQTSAPASDVIRIGDNSFDKKSSKIYIGLPPPVVGDVTLSVEDASTFPLTGSVYIGRGTGNYEGPISYTSLTNNTSYWTINLSSPVTKNHTAVETVILSQGGNRSIAAGTVVRSPANNFSPAVGFVVTRSVTLVDGETTIDGVPVLAQTPGTVGNVPAGAIVQFAAAPFSGATVTNVSNFNNGRDIELDPSLRAKIRNAIQLLARGTKRSVLQAVLGVSDQVDNKRVTSAALSEPINSSVPAQLYIDDGTGFEPSFAGQGVELIVDQAAGSEQLIQVAKFPVTPPIVVSAIDQPFGVQPGDTLTYRVDKSQETIVFDENDMAVPGLVKAHEIIDTINRKGTLVIARSFRNRNAVALVAKRFFDGTDPEELQILSGTANSSIKFPITVSRVMSLYKNGSILKKNPASGIIYSDIRVTWAWGISTVAARLLLQVDDTPVQDLAFRDSDFLQYGVTYKTATAAQWAEQLTAKVAGITAIVESNRVRLASNKTNSTASKLTLLLADDLGARSTTNAVWQSGTTTRYTVANTDGIIVGDSVTITGFANASNNGVFTVTRVASSDYVECTTTRLNGTDDETSVVGANINPNKEDLALIAFGGAQVSEGATSDYKLNRFSGEIELATRLGTGDNVTAGSEYTKAYIDSTAATNSKYNFPIQQDVQPGFFVAIDSTSSKRTFNIANGDVITQGRVGVTDNIELLSNRANAFVDAAVGDFVYIATKSLSGFGVGYSPWFPSYGTGVYEITQIIDSQTVYIRNPDATYPTLPTVITGNVSSLEDVQMFRTNGLVQKIPLSGVNLLPNNVADQINAVIQFSEAIVFNNQFIRLQSNSLSEAISNVYILATAGTGKNLYTAGMVGEPNQPHIGFQLATAEGTTFPRLQDGLDGLFANSRARGMIFGATTASDLTAPYVNEDTTQTFLSSIKIDDIVKYTSGINNQQLLALRSIDSNTELTPQTYNGIRPIFGGDSYVVSESHKFSPYDRLIIELDQDSTNKTFLIPMYRTGQVKGTATTTTFDAYDADSAPGTDFNNALWRDFSFQDFSLMMRARNVYKASVADTAVIIRSAQFGLVGNDVRFGIFYPGSPNQGAYAIHSVFGNRTEVSFFLASGPARANISAVGIGYKLTRSGNLLTLDYAGIGASPNFSGNGVVPGDIASITDSAFATKSPFFSGSGKVISVSATQLVAKLQGSATINTSYAITAVQDSGAGLTSTYLLPNTGLLSLNDTVEITGFTRAINNGVFTVVGINANVSITVGHSIRTTITHATQGFRRTSNVASVQFAGSLTGQVQIGDTVVVSNMSEATLNGTFTVSALFTTTLTNDTISYTAAGIDLPVARTVTTAIWQSGNTVRYACTNTSGIGIGNTVVIAGFANASNNNVTGFLVSNISNNNWIEVTSTRSDGTDDEVGPVAGTARPTYFLTDTSGTAKVINAEVAAATADLIVVQASSIGVAAFPLGGTTAADISTTLAANPIISKVVTAVNALGYLGTGVLTLSTFDEAISVAYNHTPGDSFIQLYDGNNAVLDFYSAAVNPQKNFTLKTAMLFSHPDYDISTAPNITGELAGEYFKLVPTTFRNLEHWFNKSSITSFSIVGSAASTADGGTLQLASQTIGTSGAVKVSGGSANGINSFVKTPASIDAGRTRIQVNSADITAFITGQIVKVQNVLPSRKPKNFVANDLITVQSVNGTLGRFKARDRAITLASTNSITTTDVSASYGRSAGKIWRWTGTGTPAAPFTGTKVGDVLMCENINMNVANRTAGVYGDGSVSFFPVLNADSTGNWIEVHNPTGLAEGPTLLGSPLNTSISPAFFIEWKHLLDVTAVMKVEAVEFRNLFRYSWVSGAQSPQFAENGVSIDDYVSITGNSFLPENRGTFRVVAVADDYFVVENTNGSAEQVVNIDLAEDVRFFYSESAIVGDKLNVSDLPFLESNRGTHTTVNYGTDATLKTQYLTLSITNSSNQSSVQLSGIPNTFFVTDGALFSAYRYITNFATDSSEAQSAIVYLSPATNTHKISNSFNTSITPVQKLSFSNETAIGVDGYRYYTGLLATVQKTVDGYDPDPINFPGYKAAGTQIETVPPLVKDIYVNVIVKTSGGINLSTVSDAIKSAILNYIKGLGVGDDVIISELTAAVMSVEGVESATLFEPAPTEERLVIQDNEKAVISIDSITISSS